PAGRPAGGGGGGGGAGGRPPPPRRAAAGAEAVPVPGVAGAAGLAGAGAVITWPVMAGNTFRACGG
ncbi:hypothetical protein, partial [Nocardia cyriacigeorgica]|uniref:hypothetical protein n=1 Tax=Nocardia cyriacigeorgica TaxID=135487 RepID=UPI0024574643